MIPIKINKKKYKVKAISELTTREFIELSKIEDLNIIKYIAWQTGSDLEKAFLATTSPTVQKAIGAIPDITKLKKPNCFDYKMLIDTVGQRHQVESCEYEGYELLVFCLAVSQARSNNIDDVEKLYYSYLDLNFTQILPAGFFFFKSYKHGKRNVINGLKMLLSSSKIKKLKNKRVHRS